MSIKGKSVLNKRKQVNEMDVGVEKDQVAYENIDASRGQLLLKIVEVDRRDDKYIVHRRAQKHKSETTWLKLRLH